MTSKRPPGHVPLRLPPEEWLQRTGPLQLDLRRHSTPAAREGQAALVELLVAAGAIEVKNDEGPGLSESQELLESNKPGFRHFVEFYCREGRWFLLDSVCMVFSTRFHGLIAREVYKSSNVVVRDVDENRSSAKAESDVLHFCHFLPHHVFFCRC